MHLRSLWPFPDNSALPALYKAGESDGRGRRALLLASLSLMALPGLAVASVRPESRQSWDIFIGEMRALAAARAASSVHPLDVAREALALLRDLDVTDAGFLRAARTAYESGNRYWLWQRLTREPDLNGGILTVEQGQDVPLHDHPGATGMLRVLAGELEVWQFDRLQQTVPPGANEQTVLQRVSHRKLLPGDTALLSPHRGNIHALRAISRECSMLDYFIPPYNRQKRTWYEPETADWHDSDRIGCRTIPENDYYAS